MAVVVLTTIMVLLLTRSLMTALRPYMAWSTVFQTIADKHVFIHKWIGKMLVFCSLLHVCGHIFGSIPAIIGETDSSKINKAFTYGTKITFNFNSWTGALQSWPAVTGVLLLVILTLFWALSIEKVRKKSFEAFHYPHLVLICLWCGMLIAHGAKQWLGIGVPLASVSVLPMVLMYFLLRFKDIKNGSHDTIRISAATIKKSSVLLEIDTGSAGYAYETGMYCMLNVPEISSMEWHPFTIASGGGKQKFKILFATIGDWTNKLREMLIDATKYSKPYPKIRVRGGYGAPAEGMKDHKHIILVGGGVGATPFLSFLSNITNAAKNKEFEQFAAMQSAVFFWLSRDPDDFILVNEYNTIINDTPSLKGRVEVRLCLTKALDTSKDSGGVELALLWMGVEIAMTKFESPELEKELGIPTQFGRPKWNNEFFTYTQELKKKFGQKLDVSVFACGAQVLTDALEEACQAVSDGQLNLQLFAEEF
jgi:predicted ferric reductase